MSFTPNGRRRFESFLKVFGRENPYLVIGFRETGNPEKKNGKKVLM